MFARRMHAYRKARENKISFFSFSVCRKDVVFHLVARQNQIALHRKRVARLSRHIAFAIRCVRLKLLCDLNLDGWSRRQPVRHAMNKNNIQPLRGPFSPRARRERIARNHQKVVDKKKIAKVNGYGACTHQNMELFFQVYPFFLLIKCDKWRW